MLGPYHTNTSVRCHPACGTNTNRPFNYGPTSRAMLARYHASTDPTAVAGPLARKIPLVTPTPSPKLCPILVALVVLPCNMNTALAAVTGPDGVRHRLTSLVSASALRAFRPSPAYVPSFPWRVWPGPSAKGLRPTPAKAASCHYQDRRLAIVGSGMAPAGPLTMHLLSAVTSGSDPASNSLAPPP